MLAAGAGSRLRPLTRFRPKPLCPVGDVTLLDGNLARVAAVVGTGADRLAPEVRERVRHQSEGNALYAIELVRHLLAEGAIEVRAQRLERAPRWNDAFLPRRLSELVSTRLQRLTEEQRGLLDAAAVDGVTFDGEALAKVLGLNLLHVLRSLQHLTREPALVGGER